MIQAGRRGGNPGGGWRRRWQQGPQVKTLLGWKKILPFLLLRSVEFFSIPKQEWVSLADMTIARLKFHHIFAKTFHSQWKLFEMNFYLNVTRTEHGLAVINGIPTVGPNPPTHHIQTRTKKWNIFVCLDLSRSLSCLHSCIQRDFMYTVYLKWHLPPCISYS